MIIAPPSLIGKVPIHVLKNLPQNSSYHNYSTCLVIFIIKNLLLIRENEIMSEFSF